MMAEVGGILAKEEGNPSKTSCERSLCIRTPCVADLDALLGVGGQATPKSAP